MGGYEMASEATDLLLQPVYLVLQVLASYGWLVVGLGGAGLYGYTCHLRPALRRWRDQREDAELHKDPDRALARMEAIQRARDKQQEHLAAASVQALEAQKEREEKKRAENAERLEKYGRDAGHSLRDNADYLPLSGGGGAAGTYRAPKRSACGGGGCGK